MIFRQLCHARKGTLSYLLGDPVTREAVLIDPVPELLDSLTRFIHERGLILTYILQTHYTKEQFAAGAQLRTGSGARMVAHESARDEALDLRLRHQDVLYFGEERLQVLHTPGQSPCAVTYFWEDRLFTGKTLLVNSTLPCSNTDAARILYQSITQHLLTFPGETLVYPGLENKGRRLTSIEEIRRKDQWFHNQHGHREMLGKYSRLFSKDAHKTRHIVKKPGASDEEVHRYSPDFKAPVSL
ncbi:MBL fold metallo-hydrolase [Acidithiobacillus marinus]|uniref:MBL fold metallo-hydrolase n=1 Tax=Acidithiobacillus marinus TaxID=187490 RepID=A0A2I1DMN4_9PROT|nr:MBL fold metallo-hydrolase [Acidithiobacillus marinus]PKY11128.1 MBL fold metallo-hydrolase [Acidithiobacillus marinus]